MKFSVLILTCLAVVASFGIACGQRINSSSAQRSDEYTTFLAGFEDSLPPECQGDVTFVPGRFGQAVVVGPDGLSLASDAGFDVNSGTVEFWVRVNDPQWFSEDHTLVANDVGHGQKGNVRIWYWRWQDRGHLRFDLHNFANLHDAYLIFPYPTDTNWHHVACAWDHRQGLVLFIDGARVTAKTGQWEPVADPGKRLILCPQAGDVCVDELRISKASLLGPAERAIAYGVTHGPAGVKDGRTVLPVTVTFSNDSGLDQMLSGKVTVIDYYQNVLAEESVDSVLAASQKRELTLDVVTDNAGPYVKVRVDAAEGKQAPLAIDDEQIVFVDVLTGPRLRMSLNGQWEMADGDPMNILPPEGGEWAPCELPYRWETWQGVHTRWFRKTFTIPEPMRGKRIELQLGGVRFRADVFLNRELLVSSHTDQMPLHVDLTPAAKPGQSNELLIAVTDWVSCAAPELLESLLPVWSRAWLQGREVPGMPFIRPCTCSLGAAGIGDPIYVVATQDLAVDSCRVTPSVRNSELKVATSIRSDSKVARTVLIRHQVIDGTETVIASPPRTVAIEPGMNESETVIPVDLGKIRLWWPKKPYLYRLRTQITVDGAAADCHDVRFGFREFRADGPVFRINETAIRPGAAAGIPHDYPGIVHYDEKSRIDRWYATKKFLRSFFNVNVTLVRYHTEPYPILMFDQADEIGLMIASEAWMATLPGKMKLDDQRTWTNFREFYPRWVHREFNHASLVIRSMENELGYHLPAADAPRSPFGYTPETVETIVKEMRSLGRLVKRLDPSRPIMYEGSGPVFYEVADIYNLHYPGIPGNESLFPITGRRLSIPIDSYREKNWLWDRKKPLYVGEYDSCFGEPAGFAPLLGKRAYVAGYLYPAHMAIWSYTIPGQRIDGMTAGVPWTILTFNGVLDELNDNNGKVKLVREMFTPIASFIHQYRSVYFGGRSVARTVTTLNDSLEEQPITVKWSLQEEGESPVRQGEFEMVLSPAESRRTQIEVALPDVNQKQTFTFVVETFANGESTHRDGRRFIVFPGASSQAKVTARCGLVDLPDEVFRRLNVPIRAISADQPEFADLDVLVVRGDQEGLGGHADAVDAFLRSGGRLIVLGGSKVPDFLPVRLEPAPGSPPLKYADDANPGSQFEAPCPGSSMTIVHLRIPDHPLLAGLDDELLRFWQESHITAAYSYLKPKAFSARTIIDCGSGLRQAALMEIPHGRGLIIAVQLPVLEAFDDQPAAGILLANLLEYADAYRGERPRSAVGVLADPRSAVPSFLQSLGVEPYLLSDRLEEVRDLSDYAVIVVDSDDRTMDELTKNRDMLTAYVDAGGTIWLHRPVPGHVESVNALLPAPISLKDLTLTSPINVLGVGPLAGVSNDELFWPDGAFLPPVSPRVASYTVEFPPDSDIEGLTEPCVAAVVRSGKGAWFIEEVAWDTEFSERTRAMQFVRAVLPNFGLQVRAQAAAPISEPELDLGFHPIDISAHCNEGFVSGIWNGPNQGLHELPLGDQKFKGILHRIIDPSANAGKSCIGFRSEAQNKGGAASVTLSVEAKAAAMRMLITSMWTCTLPATTKILDVNIEYADGSCAQTEVCYGRDVMDWCPVDPAATEYHPAIAWIGPKWPRPGLYDFAWINPQPEKTIARVTLSAAHDLGFAVLLAVTVQDRLSEAQKTSSEWIPGLER